MHDVLNVFQCTGLNNDDQYFMKPCPAQKGDYLEFFAEIDLLCAMSCCPGGDLSVDFLGRDGVDPLSTCHPLEVDIYKLESAALVQWQSPKSPDYKGRHGLQTHATDWESVKRGL